MMDLYYDEVMSGHRWGASEGYSYTQLDEHTWQCLVIEDEAVSSRVQVIVTELDNSETVVIDGNRYEIPDLEALDRKSFKKIELFL